MNKKNEDILNKKEKKEIINDVADAINKAKGIRYTSLNKEIHSKKVLFITAFIVLLISSSFVYWVLANNPKTIFARSVVLSHKEEFHEAARNRCRRRCRRSFRSGRSRVCRRERCKGHLP